MAESAEADTFETRINVRRAKPPTVSLAGTAGGTGAGGGAASMELGWSLVTVSIRNLTMTVNHHFDYKKDGHSRKCARV